MTALKTIKRIAPVAASTLLMIGATWLPASAAEPTVNVERVAASAPMQSRDGYDRRVRIHNQTGWTMLRFYASDSRRDDWQEDMLGRGTLGSGSSILMNIDDGSGACMYDFKAEFTNGEVLTRFNVNVCQIADYHYSR